MILGGTVKAPACATEDECCHGALEWNGALAGKFWRRGWDLNRLRYCKHVSYRFLKCSDVADVVHVGIGSTN
jgi:hypothetical protein